MYFHVFSQYSSREFVKKKFPKVGSYLYPFHFLDPRPKVIKFDLNEGIMSQLPTLLTCHNYRRNSVNAQDSSLIHQHYSYLNASQSTQIPSRFITKTYSHPNRQEIKLAYARHYKPRLVYFFPPFFSADNIVEWFIMQINCGLYCRVVCNTRTFSEPHNPRFIIESGFKSRADYNGVRNVFRSPNVAHQIVPC